MSTTRAIGIDFGTSTSLVAEGDATRGVTLAPLGRSTTYMPTLLGITDHSLLAGDSASDLPERQIIRSIKRNITENIHTLPHPLDEGSRIDVDEGISTVLRQLAANARDVGVELTADTIRFGCPAMWNAAQRTRLLILAQKAGIPVLEHTLIDEPIAAGMAWVSHRVREHDPYVKGRLLVFDMGGGTLDVALLQVDTTSGDHAGEISVLSSKGVNEAGDVLDLAIRDQLREMLNQRGALDLDGAELAEVDRKLLPEARQAKIMLSSQDEALVHVAMDTMRLPVLTYTREQLEDAFAKQLDAAEALVWHVVRESFLTHDEHRSPAELRQTPTELIAKSVDRVLLAGGMSRIPAVRERLTRMFPHAEIYDNAGRSVGPDEAIVAGLAETTAYDRVNLHRPPFDFLLRMPDGETRTLYKAYSPLYESWLASQRTHLYYELEIPWRSLPEHRAARLVARSPMGVSMVFRIDGLDQDGIEIPLGRRNLRFRIRPNGRISMTDGKGHLHGFRVDRWPVLRGKDHAVIQLERLKSQPKEAPPLPWHLDPRYA